MGEDGGANLQPWEFQSCWDSISIYANFNIHHCGDLTVTTSRNAVSYLHWRMRHCKIAKPPTEGNTCYQLLYFKSNNKFSTLTSPYDDKMQLESPCKSHYSGIYIIIALYKNFSSMGNLKPVSWLEVVCYNSYCHMSHDWQNRGVEQGHFQSRD